jgi:hypothetical protein
LYSEGKNTLFLFLKEKYLQLIASIKKASLKREALAFIRIGFPHLRK